MPNPEKPLRKGFNPNASIEIQLIESLIQLIEFEMMNDEKRQPQATGNWGG
ncbi:MAG: hypothetical protein NT166_16360 [Candidatus Aminicenantes bacterium]|nr:hypothetical protein [Candidatus Aminicenantes bacterium]